MEIKTYKCNGTDEDKCGKTLSSSDKIFITYVSSRGSDDSIRRNVNNIVIEKIHIDDASHYREHHCPECIIKIATNFIKNGWRKEENNEENDEDDSEEETDFTKLR